MLLFKKRKKKKKRGRKITSEGRSAMLKEKVNGETGTMMVKLNKFCLYKITMSSFGDDRKEQNTRQQGLPWWSSG